MKEKPKILEERKREIRKMPPPYPVFKYIAGVTLEEEIENYISEIEKRLNKRK
ncbi:MAG: hypothetical protein ACE5K0_09620 [Candidatus Methanofastidiosia archaeon]